MKTRAKFVCTGVTKRKSWYGSQEPDKKFMYEAEFSVVTSGDENKEFWLATPSGTIKLTTLKDDNFECGVEYYVDFTKVE